jgi:hypothetical protein
MSYEIYEEIFQKNIGISHKDISKYSIAIFIPLISVFLLKGETNKDVESSLLILPKSIK